MSVQELERRFSEASLPPEINSSVICSDMALYVAQEMGGEVWGYWNIDNPTAQAAPDSAGYIGHDFALVGGRFIVDIWARDVEMTATRAVFDLEDPADATEIRRLYGERQAWESIPRG
jgi:hypothetical protein